MSSELLIGLRISLIGMGVTFLAVSLLILVIWLLVRLFPAHRSPKDTHLQAQSRGEQDEQRLEETAVALAVGVSLLEQEQAKGPAQRDPSLGKLLEK